MPNPYGNVKHGLHSHPLYVVWKNIKQRSTNPRNPKYKIYGPHTGRGLWHVWFDVAVFIAYVEQELGPRPGSRHSIDRIDNARGYEPGNIRWATYKEQYDNFGHPKTRDSNGRFE